MNNVINYDNITATKSKLDDVFFNTTTTRYNNLDDKVLAGGVPRHVFSLLTSSTDSNTTTYISLLIMTNHTYILKLEFIMVITLEQMYRRNTTTRRQQIYH